VTSNPDTTINTPDPADFPQSATFEIRGGGLAAALTVIRDHFTLPRAEWDNAAMVMKMAGDIADVECLSKQHRQEVIRLLQMLADEPASVLR